MCFADHSVLENHSDEEITKRLMSIKPQGDAGLDDFIKTTENFRRAIMDNADKWTEG